MNRVRESCDVLVIGGGPAGLAAANRAAMQDKQVILVDDNPALGGQIWRGATANSKEAAFWLTNANHPNIRLRLGARVFYQKRAVNGESWQILAEGSNYLYEFSAQRIILATGAREQFLPFPGWTLPNVVGVGGLQALVKGGLPIAEKRIIVTGSGPLLLAVAAYLRTHGADVRLIAEQAPLSRLIHFGTGLVEQPAKILQAIQLRRQLGRVPYLFGTWVTKAERANDDKYAAKVTLQQGKRTWTESCDYLACAFHLVPNTELASLFGCVVEKGTVQVNPFQETSQAGIYCAGESTGIGGVELALVEGQIAGLAAAGNTNLAREHFAARTRLQRFAKRLNQTFAPREELRSLPTADTIICRCEDVPLGKLQKQRYWREAKLHTRCGMGPCQGRICGAALKFCLNWEVDSIRPPVFPARLESLAGIIDTGSSDLAH